MTAQPPLPFGARRLSDMPLTDVLRLCGFTHRRVENRPGTHAYAHDVFDADGALVITGTANAVWGWLRETGRLGPSCAGGGA